MNFSAKYLGILGNAITDDKGISIPTLKSTKDKNFFFDYKKPKILCDVLLKGKLLIEPEVREIRYEDLYRMGFCIVSMKKKLRKGSSVVYKIIKKARSSLINLSVLDRIPYNHYLEYDIANGIVRIVGKNAGIDGYGEWIPIQKE